MAWKQDMEARLMRLAYLFHTSVEAPSENDRIAVDHFLISHDVPRLETLLRNLGVDPNSKE